VSQYVPVLNCFPKCYRINEYPVKTDRQGIATHVVARTEDDMKTSILWDMSHVKYIDGVCLESFIKNNTKVNFRWIVYILKEVMGMLRGLQKYAKFTHFDCASRNIFIGKPEIPNDSAYSIFLWDENYPIIAPSDGSPVHLIDLEFSYVSGIEKTGTPGRLDLIEYGFFPFFFDPESDPIYAIMSALEIYAAERKSQSVSEILQKLKLLIKERCHKDVKMEGCRTKTTDFIKTEILEYLNKSKEFDLNKQKITDFIMEYHYVILEYIFHGLKWSTKNTFFVSEETFEKYPKPATLNSEEIEDWIKSQDAKKVSFIDKIASYFSSQNIERAKEIIEKQKNYEKDTSMGHSDDTSFKNTGSEFDPIVRNRNYIYRVYLKIAQHLLSVLKENSPVHNKAQTFLLLKKLMRKFETKPSVKIDQQFESILKYLDVDKNIKWQNWFVQFLYYKSLICEPLFEMYRHFGIQSFQNHEQEYNFEENIENHFNKNEYQKLFFDPYIGYQFLEALELPEPPLESDTRILIYKHEYDVPKQIIVGDYFDQPKIDEMNSLLSKKKKNAFLQIIKQEILL
jgi:hypothetical protein